jgi:hypothetical protein
VPRPAFSAAGALERSAGSRVQSAETLIRVGPRASRENTGADPDSADSQFKRKRAIECAGRSKRVGALGQNEWERTSRLTPGRSPG